MSGRARDLSPWAEAALAHLAVLHGPASKTRWTLAVLSYQYAIDDTGKENQALAGAAGYLAKGDEWTAYMGEWEDALPEDLRGGKFHAKQFIRDIGAGRREATEVFPLLEVLRSRMHMGTSRLVLGTSWKRLPNKYKKLFGLPYGLCMLLLLEDALVELNHFVGMDPAERLVSVAEYMDPYDPKRLPSATDPRRRLERRTRDLWDFWVDLRGLRDRVPTVVFDTSQRSPQLQAADFFAHASYRVASRPHRPHNFRGLPLVSGSPPFPPAIYQQMNAFLRATSPVHYWSIATDQDLERNSPAFDEIIERMEEDPNDPLARYFKLDPGDDDASG